MNIRAGTLFITNKSKVFGLITQIKNEGLKTRVTVMWADCDKSEHLFSSTQELLVWNVLEL